jgi:hypothetical protein
MVLVFLSSNGFSQATDTLSKFEKFDKLSYTANVQYIDGDYKNALHNFNEAIKVVPDDSPDIYCKAAAAALQLKEDEEAKRLIIKSIKTTNATLYFFKNFDGFNAFREHKLFDEIEKEYPKYQAEFFKNVENPEIYIELQQMIKGERAIKKTDGSYHDRQPIDRLIEITKQFGWQELGWSILWQERGTYGQNNEIWNFFKPYIDNEIKYGKVRKSFWAIFDDAASIDENKTQLYGLFWSQLDEFPIMDIKNVDKRLKSVGLPPLWYMKKVVGVKLPEDYEGSPETSEL